MDDLSQDDTRRQPKSSVTVSVKEYANDLRTWMSACACWQTTMLHYSLAAYQRTVLEQQMSVMHNWNALENSGNSTSINPTQPDLHNNRGPFANANNDQSAVNGQHVTRYRVPAVWKRVCAEAVDFIILMFLRVCLVVLYIKVFNLDEALSKLMSSVSVSELLAQLLRPHRVRGQASAGYANAQATWSRFGEALGRDANTEELDEEVRRSLKELEHFLLVSPFYMLFELLSTGIVTAYETLFTMREWRRGAGACTPGKKLFGLRLVRATDMLELPDAPEIGLLGQPGLLVEVHGEPARIGFIAAFCRAVMKNFSQTFLFPLSLTALFARNHRAVYDIVTNVIVVELV